MTTRRFSGLVWLGLFGSVLAIGCSTRVLKKGGMELTTQGVSELQFDDEGDGFVDLRNEGPGTVLIALLDEDGGVLVREDLLPGSEKRFKLEEVQRVHLENRSDEPADVFFELLVHGVDNVLQVDMTR